jgi:uncharacterized protein
MAFRILCIDGGGLRGIIPLLILEHIIKSTSNKSIADRFDMIAGTSTGGIIACALTVSDPATGNPKYSVSDVRNLYEKFGRNIFPPKINNLSNYFSPKYGIKGLDKVLDDYFSHSKLQDCIKPVFISSYDVNSYAPLYFSSRFINPTSTGFDPGKNFQLSTICRCTSAAPTYFPSHFFDYFDQVQNQAISHNAIDGGVFVNNPALAAVSEVIEHKNDPLYKKSPANTLQMDDIIILSLGTGITSKSIRSKRWGKLQWAKKLFEIMMQGSSQSVHKQMNVLFNQNQYMRVNVLIPKDLSEMDDSSPQTMQKLKEIVTKEIINNAPQMNQIIQFLQRGGMA